MTKPLSVVLVGCGAISRGWLKAAKDLAGVTIDGLVDLNRAAADEKKAEFGLAEAQTGTSLRSMLKAVTPDIVFDCTVPEAHVAVVLEALRHGCHVLGEKPMADSMANARRMVRAAAKAGRLHAVMQNRRYDPRIRAFRALLGGGALGDLTTLNCDFFIGAHFGGFRDRMEHVLLLDMAIHTFDQARFISGADPVAAYCHEWNPHGSWYDHDASAIAVFEMSNGLVYTYRGSWCAEGLNTSWECDWRAVCTRGSALWDGANIFKTAAVSRTSGFFSEFRDIPVAVPDTSRHDGHAECIRDFIDCVRTGRVPETTGTDNIKSLAMVFGAIRSATTGRRVNIMA